MEALREKMELKIMVILLQDMMPKKDGLILLKRSLTT